MHHTIFFTLITLPSIGLFLVGNHCKHLTHAVLKPVAVDLADVFEGKVGRDDGREIVLIALHQEFSKRIADFTEVVVGCRFNSQVIEKKYLILTVLRECPVLAVAIIYDLRLIV